ncbi:MAG: L,D-transpeptidase family protein [Candidatus Zixiibacteriota bacterium]
MNKKKRIRIIISSAVLIFMVIAGLTTTKYLRNPPTETLKNAYQSISKAEAAGANKYAYEILSEAKKMLSSGEKKMLDESRWWSPMGSYHVAESLLMVAIVRAEEASGKAKVSQTDISRKTKKRLNKINADLADWGRRFSNNLTSLDSRKMYAKISTIAEIAQNLISQNQPATAELFINQADSLLGRLSLKQKLYESKNASATSEGKLWITETILESKRTGKTAIIIDKSAHKLFVFKAGEMATSYPCALGYNSAHQKLKAGDGATPEGKYHVNQVKHVSKYYKALLLNYPNQSDRFRFDKNMRNGALDVDSQIGGLIEIHGGGITDSDWTDGCIALENKHLDLLLKNVGVGTPVTIVYSSNIGK